MDDKLARLKEIGFIRVGCWKLVERRIECDLSDLANASNVLYAFTMDGWLMYVGKTLRPLRTRMAGYRNPGPTQSTNIKNHKNIQVCLDQGKQVEVYMLSDSGLLQYGGFHLNLAAGLEDSLVRELEPEWNGGKKEGSDQSLQPTEVPSTVFAEEARVSSQEMPRTAKADDFRSALFTMFGKATEAHSDFIDVNAGQLHRRVGGYPGTDHRMPVCCEVMRAAMKAGDTIIQQPPKGKGASFTVRYLIPRPARA